MKKRTHRNQSHGEPSMSERWPRMDSSLADQELVRQVTARILAMPDRIEKIVELRDRLEKGTYAPTGYQIASAMVNLSLTSRFTRRSGIVVEYLKAIRVLTHADKKHLF